MGQCATQCSGLSTLFQFLHLLTVLRVCSMTKGSLPTTKILTKDVIAGPNNSLQYIQ